MSENQKNKEKKWLFLAVGIVVGVVICCGVVVITEFARNKSQSITQVIKHIYHQEAGKDTVVKVVKVQVPAEKLQPVPTDSLLSDSSIVENQDDFEEADFSLDDEDMLENDDVVIEEKVLKEEKIKVKFKDLDGHDVAVPADGIAYFVVQEWNTPIKNRISYHRQRNTLQVKGLKLEKINIVSIDKSYYLVLNDKYYEIRENEDYEKLIPVEINK